MFSKNEIMQAIGYTFQSPFVRKIVGVNSQGDQNALDSEVADKIQASSPLLNDIRKEHENARDILNIYIQTVLPNCKAVCIFMVIAWKLKTSKQAK